MCHFKQKNYFKKMEWLLWPFKYIYWVIVIYRRISLKHLDLRSMNIKDEDVSFILSAFFFVCLFVNRYIHFFVFDIRFDDNRIGKKGLEHILCKLSYSDFRVILTGNHVSSDDICSLKGKYDLKPHFRIGLHSDKFLFSFHISSNSVSVDINHAAVDSLYIKTHNHLSTISLNMVDKVYIRNIVGLSLDGLNLDFNRIKTIDLIDCFFKSTDRKEFFNRCFVAKKLKRFSLYNHFDAYLEDICCLMKRNKNVHSIAFKVSKTGFEKLYTLKNEILHIHRLDIMTDIHNPEVKDIKNIVKSNRRTWSYLQNISVLILKHHKQIPFPRDVLKVVAKLVATTTKRDVEFYEKCLKQMN